MAPASATGTGSASVAAWAAASVAAWVAASVAAWAVASVAAWAAALVGDYHRHQEMAPASATGTGSACLSSRRMGYH